MNVFQNSCIRCKNFEQIFDIYICINFLFKLFTHATFIDVHLFIFEPSKNLMKLYLFEILQLFNGLVDVVNILHTCLNPNGQIPSEFENMSVKTS